MTENRSARMHDLVRQRRYRAALQEATEELAGLGVAVDGDNAVTKEAVDSALAAAKEQEGFHLTWHRIWGVMLRGEVIEAVRGLASHLEGERATLVWGHSPPVGFFLDVPLALTVLPEHVGPSPADSVSSTRKDLLIVGDEGECGLRLEYNHHGHADEYELRSWGRYALSLA